MSVNEDVASKAQGESPGVGSLPKGLAILEALAAHGGPAGVSELARQLGTAKSGVHRLLRVMCDLGWVREADNGRYDCTLRVWEVGMRILDRFDLRTVAAPHLRTLAALTHESVHLSILDGADVLYLDKLDSPQPVRAYTRIGGRAPAGCVATGKAMLAWVDAPRMAEAFGALEAFTPHTLTDRARFDAELAKVRKQGFAINRGEWRAAVHGMAAPVFDARGQPQAAVGISGPADRLTLKAMRGFEADVVAAAQALSHALGYGRT